jgi:hypothetical protein
LIYKLQRRNGESVAQLLPKLLAPMAASAAESQPGWRL